jgi:Uma2 family endonuclease
MSAVLPLKTSQRGLVVHLGPGIAFSDEEFELLCERNRDLRIERTATGDLILMPPTGEETGDRNSELNMQLRLWAKKDGTGRVFDSSTGFVLPNGANRSPDAAWVWKSKLSDVPVAKREKFLPLCPDFVVELRSPTDSLTELLAKMDEYVGNGVRLGWLIDPQERRVHIFPAQSPVSVLESPERLSGEPELPGFVLELNEIWDPVW